MARRYAAVLCGILVTLTIRTPGTPRAFGLQDPQAPTGNVARPSTSPSQRDQQRDESAAARRALLDKYCVTCHNARLKTAGLELDTLDVSNIPSGIAVWEKVVRKLRTGSMPPAAAPKPDKAAANSFVASLESALDRFAEANPNPGFVPIHRLNRTEYRNAVRDLLGIEINEAALPSDNSDLGFDNMAGSLSLSPALLERYMSVAHSVSRLALGDPSLPPAAQVYDVPKMLFQDERMSDELPFGSRGGIAVRHYFPFDGEYTVKVALKKSYTDYIVGLDEPQDLDVRLDGRLIKRFRFGGESRGTPPPSSYSGNIFGDPEWENYAHQADAKFEVRVPVKAGTRVVGVSFPERPAELEGVLQPPLAGFSFAIDEGASSPWGKKEAAVDSVTVAGPLRSAPITGTSSRRRLLVCVPARVDQETDCASKILSSLGRRAYRRPVTAQDTETLMTFYRLGREQGSFESGIGAALERLLVDPDFLFRAERNPSKSVPGPARRISDLELASRLSFFLWSSIPDDELLDVASRGKLSDPVVLERQVRRMLADQRSEALVDNFAGQWLYLRNVRTITPDPDLFFPDFDDNLREAFERETKLFVGDQLKQDRSVVDLIGSNYSFVNARLAKHYGIPGVYGSHFRRVTFEDGVRGGLLGQGSVLTVTSYPNRTSPVLRGAWLLKNVLGTPPPPPPPNVPALKDSDPQGKTLSMRGRMEQHRKNPVCATCHARMDPLGFALENFDAIGRWRTVSEAKTPIDASGVLTDGTRFEGISGLRKLLLERGDQFAWTVTEKLLVYALGRGVEPYDMPAIRKILAEATPDRWRWSSLILGIVKSTPFQMRRTTPS